MENNLQKLKPETRRPRALVPAFVFYEVGCHEDGAPQGTKLGTQIIGEYRSVIADEKASTLMSRGLYVGWRLLPV